MWIANAERARNLDERSEKNFGISPAILMERAGSAVFEAMSQLVPETGRVAVFCGRGHNGGDGFVTARIAHEKNYRVDLIVAANEEDLCDLTREQMWSARKAGLEPIFADDARWHRRMEQVGAKDVIIDALLGIGASKEVHTKIKESIQAINRSGVPVISVDVPSGICCNTGEELGESIWALRTVTFGMAKPYLFQGIGLEHAGYWSVSEIGYPQVLLTEPTEARLLDGEWVANLLPERLKASHKGDNGHVLIIAGSKWMRGAASLAAMAAFSAGAGMVTVAGIESVCEAVANNVPEALLLPLPEVDGVISPDAAELIFKHEHKFYSALIGPGISTEEPAQQFLAKLFSQWSLPCVLDADALNAVSNGLTPPQCECVFTPHPGEMSRLLQSSIAEIQADRFQSVDNAILKFKQAVLLKGPYSIVGEPGQPMLVNCTGNSGQASAGMGDVLGGVVATLMAQDLPGYYAAGCGMFWHGAAADVCAETFGPIGYKASDLARALPQARARIVAACEER
jgi:ADP-dependent NAD(P)H-hydrate dehydratase / NAD(P)H-hydrate epimerase